MSEADFEHVTFVVPRARMEAIARVLAAHTREADPAPLAALLEDAWKDARARRASTTIELGDARDTLRSLLAGEVALDAMLSSAPAIVRESMIDRALVHARRLAPLRAVNAPDVVVAGTRRQIAEAIGALDPASPFPDEEGPRLFEDEDGVVNLHAWLEQVLECTRDPRSVSTTRLTRSAHGSERERPMRPGIEHTAYSVAPYPELWMPPEPPSGELLDHGDVVVGESGGPVRWSIEGEGARVSFLWRDTGADISWTERR